MPAGANLQTAINNAQPGDELLLAPGATYTGQFYLPNKGTSSQWIVIRTDLPDATIGAPGTRMTPIARRVGESGEDHGQQHVRRDADATSARATTASPASSSARPLGDAT